MGFAPDYPRAIVSPSPNYWASREGHRPECIVIHGTSGLMPGCLSWLCSVQSVASVHYLVDTGGTVYQLVPEEAAAWGNGIPELPSMFCGGPNPNLLSVSIETERDVGNASPVTQEQVTALTDLVADIRRRWGHLPLVPHSEISPQSRAHCPGPDYPLQTIDRGPAQPAPHRTPVPATAHTTGARYLVTKTMMARTGPSRSAVLQTPQGPQWVNRGAVLAATGRRTAHWAECIAGGHAVWIYLANAKPC